MSDLEQYRAEIDEIDQQIVNLFARRLDVAGNIANYKKSNGLPVFDGTRERAKLISVAEQAPENAKPYMPILYSQIFDLTRSYEHRFTDGENEVSRLIENAIETTPKVFPESASVACQGIAGANSQIAADKLFKLANILYFKNFDAVFTAIEKGLCRYGVIPVENSNAGSVNKVYDLMMSHNFYIVRSLVIHVSHFLMVKPGTKLSDIKEIYSHEQAINQCSAFLSGLEGVRVIPVANTAIAAKMVDESGRTDTAAIAAYPCAKIYGLEILKNNVQNSDNNYTRFICISKDPEIYPGADKTSLMVTLPHESGSLYKLLARFNSLNLNLNKLESRPLPHKEFEFMFYFDLDAPVYSERFLQLMKELPSACSTFTYLGSYSEVH